MSNNSQINSKKSQKNITTLQKTNSKLMDTHYMSMVLEIFKYYTQLNNENNEKNKDITFKLFAFLKEIMPNFSNQENNTTKDQLLSFGKQIHDIEEIMHCLQIFSNDIEKIKQKIIRDKVSYLQKRKQAKQRTNEWFTMRNTMFTASTDVCDILGKSKYNGCVQKTINKKCNLGKKFMGNRFTNHGVKYEQIGVQIYESRYNKKVLEFGLLQHPTINCLGASPDGITTDGRIVEIKIPYTRKLTGNVPENYFIQTQTQMEVCDINVCDFFEIKIREYFNKELYDKDIYVENDNYFLDIIQKTNNLSNVKVPNDRRTEDGLEKGMIGRIGKYSAADTNKYFYPPIEFTSQEQYEWLQKKQKEFKKENIHMYIDYWKVENSSYTEIKRDKKWWKINNVTEKLENTWKQVIQKKKQLQSSNNILSSSF